MKLGKTLSVEEVQLISRFESLRAMLLSEPFQDRLRQPLAFWALPTDRRLPLVLLGRTLADLLNTPFAELSATSGIGQKKMRSLVKLLTRAANAGPVEWAADPDPPPASVPPDPVAEEIGAFDPQAVSEATWSEWRGSVMRYGLGKEPLGRFAPSLKNMTRVIWNRPLEAYCGYTLREIRALKTHGEKRVTAILEVFAGLHALVANLGPPRHLVARIMPCRINEVECWVGRVLQTPGIPRAQEIADGFIIPLVDQVRIDALHPIVVLAENRLGLCGPMTTVRQAARQMGLTRARVYQLLNEINDIMQVRWPLGRHQAYELRDKFRREEAGNGDPPNLDQFHAAIELFYPGNRRGAAGPLERAFEPEGSSQDPGEPPSRTPQPFQPAMSRV
jgi:hypothetical protein